MKAHTISNNRINKVLRSRGNWNQSKLSEICKEDRKIIEPGSELASQLLYLSLEHIESDTGRILKLPNGSVEDEGKSTTFRFDRRHVLYGKLRPYLNKVALPDFEGRCTTELIPLLPNEDIDREFFAWFLRSPITVEAAMNGKTGSRMPRANMNDLLELKFCRPSPSVQKEISSTLSEQMATIARARAAAEAQLAAAKALPAAYLARSSRARRRRSGREMSC